MVRLGLTGCGRIGRVHADSIDAAVVASPTPTHVDFLTRAVRAGRAALVLAGAANESLRTGTTVKVAA